MGRFGGGLPGVLGVALLALVLAPAAALGSSYTVNTTGDNPDANPGNNVCAAGGGFCTLRAAIMEANAHSGPDEIRFAGGIVDQEITIDPSANGFYPAVSKPVKIDGCSSNPSRTRPCVGVQIDDGIGIPFLVSASDVTIKGLAIGNAFQAIQTDDTADDLTVRKNWFGLDINGTANPLSQVGVYVSADRARIGGSGGSAHRNVFANSGTGLRITKGDNTKVQGNLFGLEDDGSPLPNAENIEVVETGGNKPSGTLIGGTVTAGQAATTDCDGVCNVISAANGSEPSGTGNGIDLAGEFSGESELPAGSTTIAGNFIGLDPSGFADRGNAVSGIETSSSGGGVTIGGSSSRDRNFIGGNDRDGLDVRGGATVKRNWIGLATSGVSAVPDSQTAARFEDGTFARNRVAGNGSDPNEGLFRNGGGGSVTVRANKFGVGTNGSKLGFGGDAIRNNGDDGSVFGGPNAGDGNVIANGGDCGLLLNGRNSTIQGNYIGTDSSGADRGNGASGICLITGGATNDGNVIGGPGPAQNVISFNDDNAIELNDTGPGSLNNNEIKQNRGLGNAFKFIQLLGGANSGIPPPVIGTATGTRASGSGLPTGQKVRVYKTTSPGTGRIDRFLCADTAGTGGNWSCTYAASVPAGKLVTATRTDATGNTSELAVFRTVPFPP